MFNALKATLARQKWPALLQRRSQHQHDQRFGGELRDPYALVFPKDSDELAEDLQAWRARVLDFTWADIDGADANRAGSSDVTAGSVVPEQPQAAAAAADALSASRERPSRSRRRRAARAKKKAARGSLADVSSRTPREMPFERQN